MFKALILVIAGIAAAADDDPWAKLRDLEKGCELKIYLEDAAEPLSAQFSEAREASLTVVVKHGEQSIEKERVDRIDARQSGKDSRFSRESRSGRENRPAIVSAPQTWGRTASSTSSTLKVGPKARFETVYKRPSEARQPVPPPSR